MEKEPRSPEKLEKGRLLLSITLLVFAASLVTVAVVIGKLYFKAAVYECHYGVDDKNVFGVSGYVSKDSVFVNGAWDRLDDIRCSRVVDAETFVCPSKYDYTVKLGYEYATAKDFSRAGYQTL